MRVTAAYPTPARRRNRLSLACLAPPVSPAFAGRTFAVDLTTPDFPALARSMGAAAHAAGSVDQFAAAFTAALAEPGPTLIDVDMNALHPMGEYPPRRR